MTKKRIFIANDASILNTGYGVYGKEIISRIHNSDKFEVAELGCYCDINNPKIKNIPWKFYPNAVSGSDPRISEYQSNRLNEFGLWRFNRCLVDFKPHIVCVKPNALIHTQNGYRPISDIKIGDYVMSHSGHYRKVLKTMKRQHNGVLISIQTNADFQALSLTEEHPVLVYTKRNQTNQKKSIKQIYDGVEPQFIPAKDIEVGDLVVLPQNKEDYNYIKVDVTDYLVNYTIINDKIHPVKNTNTNGLNKIVDIDYDFGVLIGYIIGDGRILDSGVTITFNIKEEKFASNAQRILLEKFGLESVIRKDEKKNCLTVICNCVLLSEFLTQTVGTKTNKKIPSFCWTSPKDVKEGLIKGLFCSDGCYKKNTVSFTSIYKHLAYEVRQLCADLSIPVCINKCSKAYSVEGYGESAILLHNIVNKKSIDSLRLDNISKSKRVVNFINGNMVASIKRIRRKEYNGQVYNLEVEVDNSYVSNWCVHNCDVRDYWMYFYQDTSPYRHHFSWVIMPTTDSTPPKTDWLYTYQNAELVIPYTEWAKKVLNQSCGNSINLFPKIANAGINGNEFYPLENKIENKIKYFGKDINVVGLVMRNQKRKLIPDILISFKKFLENLKNNNQIDIYKKTYLYLHTSYPEENGWDLPSLLLEYGLLDKTYFTYKCRNCSIISSNKFQSGITVCKNCNSRAVSMCSTSNSISTNELNEIYNLFDIFIQYAICLGKDEQIRIKRNDKILWMPISQVKIGDEAWTHNNRWKKISNVWKNLAKSHNKRILELSVHGDYETLIATEDHEFPALTQKEIQNDSSRSIREKIEDKLRENKSLPEAAQYELSSLKSGDMLLYPIDDTIVDIDSIDISKEIDCSDYLVLDSLIENKLNFAYPRYLKIDNEFCRLVGLFVADTSSSNNTNANGIKIPSNLYEEINHLVSSTTPKELSSTSNIEAIHCYKDTYAKDNTLWSKLHADLFFNWCGERENKKLPDWTLYLPLAKQKEILIGMFMENGHYCEEKNYSEIITISKELTDQIKHILRRLRIPFSVSKIKRKKDKTQDAKNTQDCYSFEIYGCDIKNGDITTKRNFTDNVYYKNNHLIQIKDVIQSDYSEDVWCVTVDDDHTMTTKISTAFQCEGFGMPQIEAASCGLQIASVDYSAMSEIVDNLYGIKIPVDRVFREMEINADRVYPDNDYTSKILYDFFVNTSEETKKINSEKIRRKCLEIYSWDNVYKVWEEAFDSIDISKKIPWDSKNVPQPQNTTLKVPQNLTDKQFVEFICYNVINDPHIIKTANIQCLIRDLSNGLIASGGVLKTVDKQYAVNILENFLNNKIMCEQMRLNPNSIKKEDFIP